MKKIISAFLAIAIININLSVLSYANNIIPAGEKIRLSLKYRLTDNAREGKTIFFEPQGKKFPKGTVFIARLEKVKKPKFFNIRGYVIPKIKFIQFPSGKLTHADMDIISTTYREKKRTLKSSIRGYRHHYNIVEKLDNRYKHKKVKNNKLTGKRTYWEKFRQNKFIMARSGIYTMKSSIEGILAVFIMVPAGLMITFVGLMTALPVAFISSATKKGGHLDIHQGGFFLVETNKDIKLPTPEKL